MKRNHGRLKESLRSILESWGMTPRRPKDVKAQQRDGVRVLLPLPNGREVAVGELTREDGMFVFRYLPEYVQMDLKPLRAFPSFNREFRSDVLWPFFAVRIPSAKRPEIQQIIKNEHIDEDDQIQLLQRLGRQTVSNPLVLKPILGS